MINVCLNGISNFSNNKCATRELLSEQTLKFSLERSLGDCKKLIRTGIHIIPETIENVSQYGISFALAKTKPKIKYP